MRPAPARLPLLAALVVLLASSHEGRAAPDAVAVQVPRAEGLVLDGKPSEEAWAKAPSIPGDAVGSLLPSVRVLYGGGRLFVAVEVAEDPGFPVGVAWMIAPEGTATAADAVALSFVPQGLRGPRYVARGPRGVGRAVYRFEGAADLSKAGAWSVETAFPVADLALEKPGTPLRLAVAVILRTPNLIAAAPPKSAFREPATFARLEPPEGGWTAGDGAPSPEAVAKEDASDAARIAAFDDFRRARSTPYPSVEAARAALLAPLDRALAARPDLATLSWVRGTILSDLDDSDGAAKSFEAALAAIPHLREARWGLDRLLIDRWTKPPGTEPSDYDAAFARLDAEAKKRGEDDVAVRAARGILHYRRGAFAEAVSLLDPIAAAHPELDPKTDPIPGTARLAAAYAEAWAQELAFRKADDAKGDLPRVRVTTPRGSFLLELYEDEVPNTVANFVWLAKAGFYDGTTFHRVVPFFMAQGGDPLSKTGDPSVGQGPGWAIKMEPAHAPRPRRAFRGVIAMAHTRPDDEGSQFFVTTGSSGHLDGQYTVFGRVLEGQDVVDRTVAGDKIEKVEVVRARDHEYRPVTVAGTPAPEPKAR